MRLLKKHTPKNAVILSLLFLFSVGLYQCSGNNPQALTGEMNNHLALLPEDATGVAFVNIEQMRQSPFFNMMIDSLEMHTHDNDDLRDFVDATGFNLEKDVEAIYAAFLTDTYQEARDQHDNALVIAIGNFDAEKITAYINHKHHDGPMVSEAYQSYTIYLPEKKHARRSDHSRAAFCFADSRHLIAGSIDQVKACLDKLQQNNSRISDDLARQLESLKYKNGAWFTLNTKNLVQEAISNMSDHQLGRMPVIEQIQQLGFSMHLDDKLHLQGIGHFSSDESAQSFHDVFKGLLATAKLAVSSDRQSVDIINKMKVENQQNRVQFQIDINRAEIERLKSGSRDIAFKL